MIVLAGFVTSLLFQAASDDRIGKEKAPAILKKIVAEMTKKKGWHFVEEGKVSGPEDQSTKFEGVVKKDFAAAKGSAEIYAKGPVTLVASGGRFVPPDQLQGTEALQAGSFRNPALFLVDMNRLAGLAKWEKDEAKVDDHDCRVAEFDADEALIKEQIKDFLHDFESTLKKLNVGNVQAYVDTKKTTSKYRVFIGKSDLLVYKIEWTLKPVIKDKSLPPNTPNLDKIEKLEGKCTVSISKYDEALDIEIPKEIQARLGVK